MYYGDGISNKINFKNNKKSSMRSNSRMKHPAKDQKNYPTLRKNVSIFFGSILDEVKAEVLSVGTSWNVKMSD
jgi:hypothetical protein